MSCHIKFRGTGDRETVSRRFLVSFVCELRRAAADRVYCFPEMRERVDCSHSKHHSSATPNSGTYIFAVNDKYGSAE